MDAFIQARPATVPSFRLAGWLDINISNRLNQSA
jgi:hypothetical protein